MVSVASVSTRTSVTGCGGVDERGRRGSPGWLNDDGRRAPRARRRRRAIATVERGRATTCTRTRSPAATPRRSKS